MSIIAHARGVALALALTLVIAAPMSAQHGRGRDGDRGRMIERAIERLELTQEQQARIKAIREQFASQNETLIAELKAAREQMREARRDGDKAKAEQLKTQMQPKIEQMRAARERMKEQILAVLTAEQRTKLEAMKKEIKQKRGRGGEARGRGGAPMQGQESERID